MDWLSAVRSFVVLSDMGSFTKAADVIGVSASAMSKRIDWLEKQLGQTLFVRTTRQVSLNENGIRFLSYARNWVGQFDDMIEQAQGSELEPQGTLKIAATQAIGSSLLMPVIKQFLDKYENLTIHLNILTPGSPPDLEHDLVITSYYEEFDSAAHKGIRLADYQMTVFGAPSYLSQCEKITAIEDLAAHKMLLSNYYQKKGGIILEDGSLFDFSHYNFVSDHLDALMKAAIQGMGLIFISPQYVARELKQGVLIPVLPDLKSEVKQLWAYYPNTRFTPYKTRLFIDELKQSLTRLKTVI
ncbi:MULTISPECIES: LysR family transcriptional regulator [Pseudoalteromonas]|uniref:LysR family transcriptional regulator n=1 Tax=Pseudoalteromonas obscura TaxID=3048491 RepID=A0ABT7EMM3_9GAMM|nr:MULTISPECIES: LysR family transcriptional regulator [Pseudoalteromonas]MBQ4837797.1 LysR family transcriptional regulator [Pseudoalteromonas luteoviolacea]MDK2596258.1 LysR family transcriptional regulator [Pseudoalteromonas sp. P94(2023)]